MILLDTNICIYIINHKPANVIKRFYEFQLGEIGLSAIVASELSYGVHKSGSPKNRQALELFLAPLEILAFDESVIWHYAKIRNDLEKRGCIIGAMDMLIAAHALSSDSILVTNNQKEFSRVPGLKLDNWVN